MSRIKSYILGLIYRLSIRVPKSVGICILNRYWPWAKPVLDYMELHLADHCNLNCAGCVHYSPYLEKHFPDIGDVEHDFSRLAKIFANVRHIRLMGGEPLLNPDCSDFVRLARRYFQKSKITLVTNGLLLSRQNPIWGALRDSHVGLDWTMYPPMAKREREIRTLCSDMGVILRVSPNSRFFARLDPSGSCDEWESFRWCRDRFFCPFLKDGRLYPCAQSHFAAAFNRRTGATLIEDPGIDIHLASARTILAYLLTPSPSCRYCTAGARLFNWHTVDCPEDWYNVD